MALLMVHDKYRHNPHNCTAIAFETRNMNRITGQKSRRSQRQTMKSVSQSTTASNLSNQPRADPINLMYKDEKMAELTTIQGQITCLTPTTADRDRSWSETTASPSEPDDMAAEPDMDLEHDEKGLSDDVSDWDDVDTVPHKADGTYGLLHLWINTSVVGKIV